MGRITLHIDDKLEEKFRGAVGKVKGAYRSNLKDAFEEAIKLWLEKNNMG